MGRYSTQTTDKARELKEWVQSLAGKINLELIANNPLCSHPQLDASLHIRDPFKSDGKDYFNGFIGVKINFSSKEPLFLTDKDKEVWYLRMRELAERKFGIDTALARGLNYASIDFEESSEEDLYVLTPNKEAKIRAGFSRIRKFVEWYSNSVEGYNKVIEAHINQMKTYLKGLESLTATQN